MRLTPEMEMLAVASPDYMARHGEPVLPADLHRHSCINWRYPGDGSIYRREFEKDGKAAKSLPSVALTHFWCSPVSSPVGGLGPLGAGKIRLHRAAVWPGLPADR